MTVPTSSYSHKPPDRPFSFFLPTPPSSDSPRRLLTAKAARDSIIEIAGSSISYITIPLIDPI